jgi:hypothetical protein
MTRRAFVGTAGTCDGEKTVTTTDGTRDATIYYTTYGSSPTTNSTKYKTAIKAASSEAI